MKPLEVKQEGPAVPALLRDLTAVVVALLDHQARVVDCNQGFRRLIGTQLPVEAIGDVRHYFVRPRFADFGSVHSEADGTLYQGILNIGDVSRQVSSLLGQVSRHGDRLLLVGEHDVADLERLNATVIQLNDELTDMQRQLVRANRTLKDNERRISALMLTDTLTDVPNRRHFNQRFGEEISRSQRHAAPLSLAIADVDHFKWVNDRFGHSIGDEVLRFIAETLRKSIRQSDFLARFGGEEFVLLFPNTGLEQALRVAEKIRGTLAASESPLPGQSISASFGVSTLQPGDDANSLLHRADAALYQAKRGGRNRVMGSQGGQARD